MQDSIPTSTFTIDRPEGRRAVDAIREQREAILLKPPPRLEEQRAADIRISGLLDEWLTHHRAEVVARRTRARQGHSRAPRAASPRRRRTSSSSTTSGADPGDPESDLDPSRADALRRERGDQAERLCLAVDCSASMEDKAPQAKFCSDACRKNDERLREERDALAVAAWERRQIFGAVDWLYEMATDGHGRRLGGAQQRLALPDRPSSRSGPAPCRISYMECPDCAGKHDRRKPCSVRQLAVAEMAIAPSWAFARASAGREMAVAA